MFVFVIVLVLYLRLCKPDVCVLRRRGVSDERACIWIDCEPNAGVSGIDVCCVTVHTCVCPSEAWYERRTRIHMS